MNTTEQHQEQQARTESLQRGQVQHEPQYLDDVPDWTFSLGATDWRDAGAV